MFSGSHLACETTCVALAASVPWYVCKWPAPVIVCLKAMPRTLTVAMLAVALIALPFHFPCARRILVVESFDSESGWRKIDICTNAINRLSGGLGQGNE